MATANPSALHAVIAVCAGMGLAASACVYRPVEFDVDDTDGPTTGDERDWDAAVWGQVSPSQDPGPTWYGSLVYDPARKTVLLYGGGAAHASARAELWELDGDVWTLLCEACEPGPRFGAAFFYDSANERVVLFGGSTEHGGGGALADAWTFADGSWDELPTSGVAPRTFGFAHAYDAERGVLVVFGGQTSNATLSDEVYELSGSTWSGPHLPAERPSARDYVMGAYAKSLGGVIVSGSGVYEDDAWLWNGSAWKPLCGACTGTGRGLASMVEAPPRGHVLMVGGWTGSVELSGTWRWNEDGFELVSELPVARDTVALVYGLDPISWTPNERWIRCPTWINPRGPDVSAGSVEATRTSSGRGLCASFSMRA